MSIFKLGLDLAKNEKDQSILPNKIYSYFLNADDDDVREYLLRTYYVVGTKIIYHIYVLLHSLLSTI